jgi:hypothetical protein
LALLFSLVDEESMTSSSEFTAIALSLDGTTVAPHFDRQAFKVKRIYATLAADGRTANLKLTPDEQEFKVLLAPEAFAPLDNAWGRQGWTGVLLDKIGADELRAVLAIAHAHAVPAKPARR